MALKRIIFGHPRFIRNITHTAVIYIVYNMGLWIITACALFTCSFERTLIEIFLSIAARLHSGHA